MALLLVAIGLLLGVTEVSGQSSRDVPRAANPRDRSLEMRETEIRGEQQLPEIFFIVPGGTGGDVETPHLRDYRFDILKPVVKPWLERDESLGARVAERGDTPPLPPSPDLPPAPRRPAGPPPRQPAPPPDAVPPPARPDRQPTAVPRPARPENPPPRKSVPILIPEE